MDCRILYLVLRLVGGIERKLYYVLRTIDRERYRPAVVIWSPAKRDFYSYIPKVEELGVSVFSFTRGLSSVAKMTELRRLVKRLRPEVVHSYSFFTNFQAWLGTLGTASIPVGSVNSDFHYVKKVSGPWLGRFCARWPRHQIFSNAAAADQARNHPTFFKPRQMFIIRNGIDIDHFSDTLPPNSPRPQIIGIGSLTPVKRWDRLLRVALELKGKGLDFFIRVAGDGPLKSALERQVQEFGLQNYVSFVGHCDRISEALGKANFLVHTSDSEGGPNVVMEAMACGRAVVATDVGEVPNLVDNGKTGFVVGRGDSATLVERMKTLITNQDLCRKMGEAGRAKVVEADFSWDRMICETLAAYRAVGWQDH